MDKQNTYKGRELDWEVKKGGDGNTLRGVASTFGGPPDLGGDIIEQGAFSKTIVTRVNKGKVVLADGHQTDSQHLIGVLTKGEETSKDFLIEASFSKTNSAQEAKEKVLEKIIKGLSVGFRSLREEYENTKDGLIRHIREIKLMEVSLTPFPMNEKAHITSVKSLPFEDLDIAPWATPWLPGEALMRVQQLDNSVTAKKAFIGFDQDEATFRAACKCQVADLVDGELKIIPKALNAAALDIMTGKLGEEYKEHLSNYYVKMGEVPPWSQKPLEIILLEAKSGIVDVDRISAAIVELERFVTKAEPDTPADNGPPKTSVDAAEKKAALLKRSHDLKLKFTKERMNSL